MLKSTIRKNEFAAMYRLLDQVSPLDHDCGILCGSACCGEPMEPDTTEFELGIYLLPGEHKIHDKKDPWLIWTKERTADYDFPESWRGKVYFVRCRDCTACKRQLRPIQCRTFPLHPHLTEDGRLAMIMNDMKLPYSCPLISQPDQYPLDSRFIKATHTVWSRLIQDPLIADFVRKDSRTRKDPDIVYLP